MSELINKSKLNKKLVLIIIAAFAVVGVLLLVFSKAATLTASFIVTPSTSSVNINQNFTVTVGINTATQQILGTDFDLQYDQTKLQFVSMDYTQASGSQLYTCPDHISSVVGKVTLYCITDFINDITQVSGANVPVAKITFKALVGANTSTALTFSSRSTIKLAGTSENIWNGNTAGGTYTLTTPDTTPPTVSIAAPAPNAIVFDNTTINATASDLTSTGSAGTISKVEFYVNGGVPKNTDTTSPYSFVWDSRTIVDGTYPIVVKAYDGVTPTPNTNQATINVTVKNNKPDLIVQSITLSPAVPKVGEVVTFSAVVKNNGNDPIAAGVSKVTEFKIDTTALIPNVTDTTALAVGAQYTVTSTATWAATNGTHSVVVTADRNGQITESNESNNALTLSIQVYKPGDANNDNIVDGTDLPAVLTHWRQTGQTRANGNLSGDAPGLVDGDDLLLVLINWRK